jgi:serine protease inhibitor ecotin
MKQFEKDINQNSDKLHLSKCYPPIEITKYYYNQSDTSRLKLEIQEIQYDISARCNRITLYTNEGEKVLEFDDYDNYADLDLLRKIFSERVEK